MPSSETFRFAGMNIKGTPAMSAASVHHDLKVAKSKADILVFQEFRWEWYWAQLALVMNRAWGTAPTKHLGKKQPVRGAQAVLWKKKHWKRLEARSHLLHSGVAKVSEDRYVRGVLLECKTSGLRCWFVTTHFVVKGDQKRDPSLRQTMFKRDCSVLSEFLEALKKTGHPIVMQLDANVTPLSGNYPYFARVIEKHNGRMHGNKGVEFLVTFPGKYSRVKVERDWVIPTSELKTDHEGRGITARLVSGGTI